MNANIHSILRTAAIALTGGSSLLYAPSVLAASTPVTLPYEQKFNISLDAKAFTVIDNNLDGYTWVWDAGAMVYPYNADADADDWLITPQFTVDTRHVYQVSFKALAQTEGVEKLAVNMGAEPTVEAMGTQLMEPTAISFTSPHNYKLNFRPSANGLLCLGFHALSSRLEGYQLSVDNILIKKLTTVDAPDTVTHLRAEADFNGGKSATVSFRLPTTTIAGDMLKGPLRASIVCWGDTLKTFVNGTPGQDLSFVHNTDATGEHVYTVVVANEAGKGLDNQASTYVGEDRPAAVTSLNVKPEANNKLRVTWALPERGAHNGWTNPENIAFRVTDIQGHTDTVRIASYDYGYTPSSRQQLQAFTVEAFNKLGKSQPAYTDTLFLGDAYEMPFKESFARKRIATYPWVLQENASAAWIVNDHGVYADPVDHDGGLLSFSHSTEGSDATVILPKVSIKGSAHPRLKFWFWQSSKQKNELSVYVKDANGQQHCLDHLSENATTSENGEWTIHSYPLDDFVASEPIQVKLHAVGHVGESPVMTLYVDNISITDVPTNDLAVDSFQVARTTLKVGERDTFSVRVTNLGIQEAEHYHLTLLRNGKEVGKVEGPKLQPDESAWITLYDKPNSDADESSFYSFHLNYADDVNPENDTTSFVAVNILPGLPFVPELQASTDSKGVMLTWKQPLVKNQAAQWLTEGFESYPAFTTTNMGEWTLFDGDGRPTMGIRNSSGDFIDYPHAGDAMAFQVLNPAAAGLTSSTWAPHNGAQVAAAFTAGSYAKNDDWLISPPVDGQQTITFWAESPANYEFSTNEQIEIYASTDSAALNSFHKVGNTISVPGKWTQYSAELPAGTRYFAIRCVSSDQYILFLDDIHYRRSEKKLTLIGYKVYRDGVCLTPEPLTATSYHDTVGSKGHYVYTVTAIYDTGESAASPDAVVEITTAVNKVTASKAQPTAYFNIAGQRVDAHAGGVVIERLSDGSVRKVLRRQR